MTNIVLCGGSGTRLWPISRTLMPKQFVRLFGDKSLFELTVERNSQICDKSLIVSNTEQYFLAVDQLENNPKLANTVSQSEKFPQKSNMQNPTFLLEPIGRNTAPAIALACMSLPTDEIVLVTPSDHLIKDELEYKKVLNTARELAQAGNLVTFGITPTYAEIGYGYIEADGYDVLAFHEKPDLQTAQKYVEATNYYWNSGMFCFKAGVFLEELQTHSPKIYKASKTAWDNSIALNSTYKIQHSCMEAIPDDSVDCAVMERSDKVKVVPSNISWSDVGSFDALYDELPKDKHNNTANKNLVSIDSKNNLIYGDHRCIAIVDIEDLIVVDIGDALLISKKGSSQKVKQIVNEVKKTTQLHNIHLTGYRPWGSYTVLEDADGYKIKRIEVKPGKRLSLQRHKHRNEHWIVVAGTATVTVGENSFELEQNQSTYIKAGDIHRLLNNTKENLVIIEAQVGSYTGEDDIERLEDDYARG